MPEPDNAGTKAASTEYILPGVDEITRAFQALKHEKNFPLWGVLATQTFTDIHRILWD